MSAIDQTDGETDHYESFTTIYEVFTDLCQTVLPVGHLFSLFLLNSRGPYDV